MKLQDLELLPPKDGGLEGIYNDWVLSYNLW